MDFETEEEYGNYEKKIREALDNQDLDKLSKLLNIKIKNIYDAENYFNKIWKKEVRVQIKRPTMTKVKIKKLNNKLNKI